MEIEIYFRKIRRKFHLSSTKNILYFYITKLWSTFTTWKNEIWTNEIRGRDIKMKFSNCKWVTVVFERSPVCN